ncbi:Mak10 subunit, NatC N-terminal acetyltransferase-domain-containing protein [Lasiosphaeria ovina]|uniref:Mak10 subunit, NatC N-terminal acetyltransferase-domain-containing protein n=1 Tax=Lasiosphaeria ovina TaxID=92902 RepID=A0AAE0N816_9PEZI|nr:Mak10 subunit, NatC N-terminal acetyltransferase-domain-containing protein [Lasiosphaeria ovina]
MTEDELIVSEEFVGLSLNTINYNLDQDDRPPPPMVHSEGVVSTDITHRFRAACATLEPGELVKDGHFTLFESVGALEIMDPKMDSGCLAPGESLDDDYDVTRPLLPSEVLGIIDQLLCLEMAWHLGYPLSQTILTNMYIEAMLVPSPTSLEEADFIKNHPDDAPRDPMHTVLRAYCLGLVKSCWYVNDRIKGEHYYEEEDFVTNTYHRSLLFDVGPYEVRDEITEARRVLHSIRSQIPNEIGLALDFRLELRTAFLRAIELSELRSNPESLSLPWTQMKAIWEPIDKSCHLGTPVPGAFSTKIQRRLASTMPPRPIVQLSFEETSGHFRRLFTDGAEVLKVLNYSDSQSLLNFVFAFQAQKPQPLVYIRALLQFFMFKDMVILGHLSIKHVMDNDLAIVVLPCSRLLDPANDAVEAPHDPRFAIAHQMETFRHRAAQSYLDIFRALCQNRCRVRRTLCHSIQDWEMVQADAEEIDQLLQVQLDEQPIIYQTALASAGSDPAYSLPLSSWAYLYKLRLMEWIVQLGFELETYQPDELAGMYWYLSYLAKTRAQHVERIKAFTMQRMTDLRARSHPGPYGSLTPAMEAEFTRSLAYLRATILDAAVTWELADGLCCLYTVLARLRLIVAPGTGKHPLEERPYGSDALRYDIRMKPFAAVGLPELPAFDSFARASAQPGVATSSLLEYAHRAVAGARKGYDALAKLPDRDAFTVGCHDRWAARTKNSLRSVIAASIAIAALKKALARPRDGDVAASLAANSALAAVDVVPQAVADRLGLSATVPKPDDAYHEWWIVPKVIETKTPLKY